MECFVLRILGGPVVISYQHDLRQITCFDFSDLYSHGLLYVFSECYTRQRKALRFLPASSSSQSNLKVLGPIVEGFSTPKH